jgi:tetratricopeptide (TPR) repeat protein
MRLGFVHFLFSLLLLGGLTGCSQGPVAWWRSVNGKAREIAELEANYKALQGEHEKLKRDYYRLEGEAMDLRAKVESQELGERNLKATGSLDGRSLSSIAYAVPKGLRPEEELALAYEHFTEKRFAESAATFTDFFQRADAGALVDSSARYTAAVAWFQLGNYLEARKHFEEAKNGASGEQREKIHKKVDLWLRAIDRKQGAQGGTLGG